MNESCTLDSPVEYRVSESREKRIRALYQQAQAYNDLAAAKRREARALESESLSKKDKQTN